MEYTHMQMHLYFGYRQEGDIYLAEPEKALLDELYLISRGNRQLNLDELDLKTINRKKFFTYARRFPSYMVCLIQEIKKQIGSTPITNENQERITSEDN